MGSPQTNFWQETLGKALIWLSYISIGIIGKLAFDSRTQKLSWRQIMIKTALSIFVGVLSAEICDINGWTTWEKVIVPVCTLLGEGLVGYLISNWNKIAAKWLPNWFIDNKINGNGNKG